MRRLIEEDNELLELLDLPSCDTRLTPNDVRVLSKTITGEGKGEEKGEREKLPSLTFRWILSVGSLGAW